MINKILKNDKIVSLINYSLIKYIALAFGFIKGIVNAKYLGPEKLGVLGSILLMGSYLIYGNLGILFSMNREYALKEGKNKERAKEVLETTFASLIVLAGIFFCICLIVLSGITILQGEYKHYVVMVFIISIFQQFSNYYINYYRLKNNFKKINILELINNVVVLIIVLAFISQYKIYAVLGASIIVGIISFIYGYFNMEKLKIKINTKVLKELLKIGIPLLIYNLGFYILSTVDRWFIIKYLTEKDLGYYTFANSISNATLVFLSSVLFLYYPKMIKKMNEKQENNDIEKIMITYTKKLEILGVFFVVVGALLITPFINIFLPKYAESINIYRMLNIGALALQLAYFVNIYIVSNKNQMKLVYIQGIIVTLAIILNYTFIKLELGLLGIAVGTMIVSLLYSMFQHIIYLIIKKRNENKIVYGFKIYIKFIIFILGNLILNYLNFSNYTYNISLIFLTGIIYINDLKEILMINKRKENL